MKNFINKKGITLIALIITIIVMLILVAVTISVALNGGLFENASKAAKDTQKEGDREELFSAVVGIYDSITKIDLETELGTDKWQVTDNGDGTFTCTKKTTQNSFTVNGTTGKISDTDAESTEDSNTQEQENTNSFNWASVGLAGIDTTVKYKQIQSPQNNGYTLEATDEGEIKLSVVTSGTENLALTLNANDNTSINPFTVVTQGFGTINVIVLESGDLSVTNAEGTANFVKVTDNLGKLVKYNNMDWYVLYDDSYYGLQLVSKEVYKTTSNNEEVLLTLGKNDPTINLNEVTDLDNDGNLDIEKAIYSYNHAIGTLNTACADIVNTSSLSSKLQPINVRSIGSNPKNPNSVTSATYYGTDIPEYVSNESTWFDAYEGVIKKGETERGRDIDQLRALDLAKVSNENSGEYYWLAKLEEDIEYSKVRFAIGKINKYSGSWDGMSNGILTNSVDARNESNYIRPVVTLDRTKCELSSTTTDGYYTIIEK